jgi:hypothetical protein
MSKSNVNQSHRRRADEFSRLLLQFERKTANDNFNFLLVRKY